MALRDADQLLYPAVCAAVASLGLDLGPDGLGGKDSAAVKLAKQYARTIDEQPPGKAYAAAIRWLGPELHKTLESLGATPAARAAIKKPVKADARPSGLAALRAARSS